MLPANRAFNSNGLAVSGAQAKLYTTGTSTPQPFYSDVGLTTSLGTTLTANGAGRFPTAYQNSATPFRFKVLDSDGAVLDDIDPFYFGQTIYSISGSVTAATRTELAGMSSDTNSSVTLIESGREGTFVWSSANLSSLVAIDTQQGIYVAPSSDTTGASGAWVRVYGNRIKAKWFGLDPLGVVNDGTKVLSIYTLAFALAATSYLYYPTLFAAPSVEFPFTPNGINMGSTTISLTKAIATYGEAGSEAGGSATWFKWTGDCNGFEVRAGNCHFDGVAGRGSWTTASPAEGEYHFIKAYYRFSFGRLYGDSWRGDVVHVNVSAGSGGDTEGNANAVRGQWLGAFRCRRGISMEGADANAGLIDFIDANDCRHAGVYEASFLGNAYGAFQGAGNGVTGYGDPTCSFNNGHIFYVISGQETGAATNSPPATATSNTWWGYWKDVGAATAYAPQWVSGATAYRAGSGFIVPLAKVSNCSTLDYIYTEVDQPPIQTAQNTLIKGGLNGAGYGTATRYITANTNGVVIGPNMRSAGAFYQINDTTHPMTLSGVETSLDPFLIMRTGNASSTIQFQNSSSVSVGSILTSSTLGMFVDATFGVNIRFNGTTVASSTTDGINIASGKLLAFNGTTVIDSSRNATLNAVAIGGGTSLTKAVVYTPSLTPASVAAATVAEQTFTVNGLTTADKVTVNPPAIGNSTGIAGVRVSAADTLAIRFINPTAGALTPTSGTYTVTAIRS